MNVVLQWLDRTTMYRVVLYVLLAYVLAALVLSLTPFLYFSTGALVVSLVVLCGSGVATHYLCKYLSGAPSNLESTVITVLIVFFIFDPTTDLWGLATLAGVSALAVVSKYICVWRHLHIVNPVVFTAVCAAWFGFAYATWWIGNYAMLAAVLLGGALITQKIRRWELVLATVLSAVLMHVILGLVKGSFSVDGLIGFFAAWPIIFFATVMVTEPLSTPAGTTSHVLYGSLVGVLSSSPFMFGPIYSSPELALLMGNLLFYPTTLRARVVLTLKEIRTIAHNTYEYVFSPDVLLEHQAGQYLEWTLPHQQSDRRGIRRYFTIASSPTEEDIVLGIKIPENHSSFKQEIADMKPGEVIYATSLDGDFTLPPESNKQELAFIAGGIGITPFRSMTKYLIDTGSSKQVTLFACADTQQDLVWQEIWAQAQDSFGMKTVPVLTHPVQDWEGERGYINKEIIMRHITDPHNTRFYISGPPGMVTACKKTLKEMGVSNSSIVTDFFPGLA